MYHFLQIVISLRAKKSEFGQKTDFPIGLLTFVRDLPETNTHNLCNLKNTI